MRLSDLLSKAPANEEAQVERFLNSHLAWGKHKTIEVGKVAINFKCKTCDDVRTFMSGDKLSCLGVGDRVVSIDACLKCPICEATIEAWFLVVSRDGLYEQAPTVRLERYVDNRRGLASRVGVGVGDFDDLLERAQLAYEEQLGAGAMVYLRKIFEAITKQVADIAGISTTGKNGGRKPFRNLLKEVDEKHHIIPPVFSSDGYKLFEELSDIVHGDSSEEVALQKYHPCRRLVIGIIRNVASDQEMKQAIDALGWNINKLDVPSSGAMAS
ncbi:hypothetical protein [Amycolatopsis sp. DSM 110486]|uniref:hypothetical protein n=1 Tax=Amycolatopsis sp. DSM 110486 TaxID=2865832 RepID=UPI001C69CE69|nr:hypothetical protein [Amycolatopsis sp. DSM 110486]QYN18857.1 hypothetical protein K1T34_40105 [Amycolatopsis sp. DSM 110486]